MVRTQHHASDVARVVKLLVTRGADVNARVRVENTLGRDAGGWRTPLTMARRHGHSTVVDYLLSAGAREN